MKFSIITVCYNSAKTIRRTFDSVLDQNDGDYEYIVVDGASTDGTLEIIKKYQPRFQGKMRWISEPDKGIYDAMNKGIRMATGTVIGIINSDDWYEPDALADISDAMEKTIGADVYYGAVKMIYSPDLINVEHRHHNTLPAQMFYHPGTFVTKAAYERYGLFDPQYRIAADYDLMLRMYSKDAIFQPVFKVLADFTMDGASIIHAKASREESRLIRFRHGLVSPAKFYTKEFFLSLKSCWIAWTPRWLRRILTAPLNVFVES